MGRALLAAGFATTAAGLALVLTPLSAGESTTVLFALSGVAVVALGVGVLTGLERSVTSPADGRLPASAERTGADAPGDGFDRRLAALSAGDDIEETGVYDRLEAVALAVLTERRDCSRETARALLADGEWTDDPRASAFFTDERPPATERIRTVLTGEPTAARRARRVVAELAEDTEENG